MVLLATPIAFLLLLHKAGNIFQFSEDKMFKAEIIDDFASLSGAAIGEAWTLLLLAQPRQRVAWANRRYNWTLRLL